LRDRAGIEGKLRRLIHRFDGSADQRTKCPQMQRRHDFLPN
jgi:hypothetical protein